MRPHVRSNIRDALDVIVHIERRRGKRLVTEICGVTGYDAAIDRYDLEPLFEREAGI